MIIEVWLFFATMSFVLFILSCLYRLFKKEMLIYGWISVVIFFSLGITSQAIEKNYCELDASDAWSCKTEVINDFATGLLFYGLGLIDLILMIVWSIYQPLEDLREAIEPRDIG